MTPTKTKPRPFFYFEWPSLSKMGDAIAEYGAGSRIELRTEDGGKPGHGKMFWRIVGPNGDGTEWADDSFLCPPRCPAITPPPPPAP